MRSGPPGALEARSPSGHRREALTRRHHSGAVPRAASTRDPAIASPTLRRRRSISGPGPITMRPYNLPQSSASVPAARPYAEPCAFISCMSSAIRRSKCRRTWSASGRRRGPTSAPAIGAQKRPRNPGAPPRIASLKKRPKKRNCHTEDVTQQSADAEQKGEE